MVFRETQRLYFNKPLFVDQHLSITPPMISAQPVFLLVDFLFVKLEGKFVALYYSLLLFLTIVVTNKRREKEGCRKSCHQISLLKKMSYLILSNIK